LRLRLNGFRPDFVACETPVELTRSDEGLRLSSSASSRIMDADDKTRALITFFDMIGKFDVYDILLFMGVSIEQDM
jgi:hypothetical protein